MIDALKRSNTVWKFSPLEIHVYKEYQHKCNHCHTIEKAEVGCAYQNAVAR